MNRKILGLTLALALAAGCEFAKKTTYDGPGPQCRTVGAACTDNTECCSYGCVAGVCAPGDHVGTVCATTNDCGYPDFSYTQMTCKSGSCTETTFSTCRDDADVCTGAAQCCSHHCNGAACVPNNAPVVQMGDAVQTVPRNQPFTLVNTSYDPDAGDTLSYGWTITPITGGWTISANNVKNPVFNPGANTGTYTATLDVTDNWGLTRSGSVTLNVVNTPPVVTPKAATATTPRNVALSVLMDVSDANGDTLNCTWSVCRQGTATCLTAPAALTNLAGLPMSTPSAAFPTGLVGTQEGDWDVALACSDGYLTTTGTTTVTVTNTPPTITVPATRTFNLGADAASTPNASITAIPSDQNGDSIASWTWTVVNVPGTSAVTTTSLGGSAATDTAIFKPDVTGQYTLTVRACDPEAINPPYVDRPSPSDASCSTSTVVATVYPWIRPLGHSVADAAFYKSSSAARLVVIGADGTSTGALWDYDLVTGTSPVKTALPGPANAVTLTPDGGTALVGDDVNAYKIALGATPVLTTWTSTFSIGDIVALSTSDAFAFPRTNVGTTYYQRLNLSNGTFSSAYRYGAWGTYVSGSNDNWFVADTAASYLYRMSLNGQNLNTDSSRSGYTGGKVWSAANGAHVFAADGTIYAVPATPVATLTPLATTLGLTSLRSVDTSSDEGVVLAAQTGANFVARYGATFTPMVSDVLPHWGSLGNDRGLKPLFAFVSNDGKKAYVVVQTTATPDEYGLYTYSLP